MFSKKFSTALPAFALSCCFFNAPPLRAGDPAGHWTESCARCHGDDGKGRTKMGRKLKIKDLTAPSLQNRLTEERILETIAEGKQDDSGRERMPPFRDELSEDDRRALAAYIRRLAEKRPGQNSD